MVSSPGKKIRVSFHDGPSRPTCESNRSRVKTTARSATRRQQSCCSKAKLPVRIVKRIDHLAAIKIENLCRHPYADAWIALEITW